MDESFTWMMSFIGKAFKKLFILTVLLVPFVIGGVAINDIATGALDSYAGVAWIETAFFLELFFIFMLYGLSSNDAPSSEISFQNVSALPDLDLSIKALRKKEELRSEIHLNSRQKDHTKLSKEYVLLNLRLHASSTCPITFEELGLDYLDGKWVILIDETRPNQVTPNIEVYDKEALEQWLKIRNTNPTTNQKLGKHRLEAIGRLSLEGRMHYYCQSLIRILEQIEFPEKKIKSPIQGIRFFRQDRTFLLPQKDQIDEEEQDQNEEALDRVHCLL